MLLADLGDGNSGGGLLVDELTETGLALDDAEGNIHLAAESGEPDDELNRVDIVGDDNELGLTRLNELSNVVKTELDVLGLGASGGSVSAGLGLSLGDETLLLLNLGLRAVVGEETEKVGS